MKIISPLRSQDNMVVIKFGENVLTNNDVLQIIRRTTSKYLEVKLNINWLSASDRNTSFAKQMYRYMLSKYTLYNYAHIAYYSGANFHTMVYVAIKTINDLTFSDSRVAFKVKELSGLIEAELKTKAKLQ